MTFNIFAILGACAIGLSLGLMGSGGSILTVPVLVYLVDQPEKIAIAGSLIIVGSIALLGALPYIKQKQVDWNTVWLFGIPGMIGTYGGAWLSTYLSGLMQLSIFAVVMLLASYFMLRPPSNLEAKSDHERHLIKIVIDGLIVGIITGIVGVGGGFLIVPALVLLGGLTMRTAIASSLVIIALKSFSGFIKYLDVLKESGLSLDWHVIWIMILVGGLGSFIGNKIANKVPQDKLKKIFGVFLIIMGIYILIKSIPKLLA
ncbi:MAG: sulfite exporter TauE/SafE family protein [Enterobacterales bacterium]|nr:sulfite exporter TauE/SafE family protein [Enterobacterales bacterium]